MKGYIAICQHFHQPHFQLQNIREKVYSLSYSNWLNLLETLSPINGFYINLHFSGPFLYWIKNEKNDFVLRLTKLIKMGKIGIIGGFADEAFIQLSTRPDEILFQIREYEKLTKTLFNIHASDWQGFHLPERECGETLIKGVTKALLQVHASPIYYLDAETFYECYYSEPGGDADYCCKYFGFNDPVSKTTISHYPKSMLRYAFQDIVEGNKFICFPIHCDERYWFLKCDSTVCIKPVEYLDRIKQALKTSCDNAQSIKKEIKPIAIIFEDAEKFGDWSGNPDRDFEWLYELIDLISKDNEVELIGLKQYYDEQGCFDTYPISTSHSYIEWENWTAHRGIRGVVFSDEKIRKLVARVHLFENRLESFERKLISQYICTKNQRIINAVMNSIDRFEYVSELLATQIDKECVEQYMLLQRLRNMLYQEDSKWAVRHPNYGSAPYFDNMGVCLIEIAERMLTKMYAKCHYSILRNEIHRIDWMDDKD